MNNIQKKKKIFIETLEQRIMLDGAGASTFIDLIDDRNQDKILQKNSKKITKFSENKVDDKSQILPFDQVARDQKRNERKQVVFIDSQVQDYQTLVDAFNEDTEVYLIQSNEDGFKKIDSVLKDNCDVSSLHIIGHGSAGKILFGNATLSNDTIQSYNQTLRSIGQCLTEDGDILFYGCNVTSTDGGKTLISKISEVTKADIAASDDVTGKGGDWDLEKKIGIVETQNVKVVDYQSTLANGVASTNDYVEEIHGASDFRARTQDDAGQRSTDGNDFVIVRESANVSNAGTLTLDRDDDGNTNVSLDTSSNPVNSYLLFINDDHSTSNRTDAIGQVVFDNEIYGIMIDSADTVAMSNISKSGATYPTSGDTGFSGRAFESFTFYANDNSSSTTSGDWVSIHTDAKTLRVGSKNGNKGDYIRVITAPDNTDPVARNDVGVISEDATLSVSNGANASVSGSYDATGEHSGDVLQTSSTTHYDTDADSDTLTVASFRTGGIEGSGSAGTLGQALTGTYGQLTLNANGSYTYVANQSAADDLDDGDSVTDVFNYTVSDGNGGTDIATITITVLGINDAPVAQNDVGVVSEDATLSVSNGANANLSGSYDANGEHSGDVLQTSSSSHKDNDADDDDPSNLVVASFRTGGIEGSGSAGTLGQALTGTYGQLTLNANGSYTYVANQSAADDLDDGDSVTDVFNYTVSDGNGGTDIATITITVLGINDTPVAVDDTDSVDANETTTATNGSSKDVLTDDTDADDSASLTVTKIQPSGGSSSNVSSGSSYDSSGTEVTGTYGTLTIGADGSYTYVADQDAADNLDAGETVTDVFTYTVSDGTSTDTATLTITVTGVEDTTTTEVKETKKEKKEAKKERKELKKERKKIKRAKRFLEKEFKLFKSSLSRSAELSSIGRSAEFNQGLKLVDLVAESESIDIKSAKFTDGGLKVKFKVFNDEGKEVQKYYGEMKDGSPLPEWIKIDPETGKTKTLIPKGEKLVEFKIIALDVDNNIKQVTVVIDPKKIETDKEILKESRKTAKTKITINKDGLVKLNSINKDGSLNKTTTDTINENKNFEDIVKKIKPNEFLKLEPNLRNNDFVVELPDELKSNFENLKVVLKDGKEIPNWIKLNSISGEIIANPPENVEKVELKIIIENENGEVTVKDIEIDFSNVNEKTTEKLLDNDNRFVSLATQLSKEQVNLDNYGSQIINSL